MGAPYDLIDDDKTVDTKPLPADVRVALREMERNIFTYYANSPARANLFKSLADFESMLLQAAHRPIPLRDPLNDQPPG